MVSGEEIHNGIVGKKKIRKFKRWPLGKKLLKYAEDKFIVDELMLDAMYKMQNGTYAKTPLYVKHDRRKRKWK